MRKTTRTLRRALPGAMAAGAMLIALQGCGDNTLTDEGALTGSDAAMIVAGALGSGNSTAGLTSQLEEAVTFATGGGLRRTGAGSSTSVVLLDTTLTRTRTGLYSYDYWFHLVFEAPAPNTLNHRYDMRGTFDTPRLASDDTAHAELTITDLTAPALTFNGAYTRLGTQLFKLRQENNAFSSRIVAQLTDLTVEKSTKKVTAGVMDAVLTGGFENGSTFEITAKVTFLGNDQATVVINGKSYQVDLATATVTPL